MRRGLLVGAVLVALAVLAGFAVRLVFPAERGVTVLASWTRGEAELFERVLAEFTEETGIEVDYQGTTALREVLLSEVDAGVPPDVAIVPSVGELTQYAQRGELTALDFELDDRSLGEVYGAPWVNEVRTGRDTRTAAYWFPVKVDLKSLVWYDAAAHGPDDFPRLLENGGSWCLGMGSDATSGWPGTDWVEDVLLQQAGPEVYEGWARGEEGPSTAWNGEAVERAWRTFGELVAAGGATRGVQSLTRDYGNASAGLNKGPVCQLDHQGSHARGNYGDLEAAFAPSARLFPGTQGRQRGWEAGADYAAMFRGTDEAEELMAWLAAPSTQRIWSEAVSDRNAEASGTLPPPLFAAPGTDASAGPGASAAADEVHDALAATLADPPEPLCLDASDVMPPALRDAFHQAVLTFLADQSRLPAILDELEAIRDTTATPDRAIPSVCGETD
ncbi:extracellular solute-binding protein [Streptomyces sp. PT12]|uniref:extracellular solute-binding protein n=1 Tax=Streptomyces sp. PT12 TaxID=1510197 RepID=UPI000DE3C214|nr:extracellular solute-binding protein [Streptomyces sp. PT12]RBM07373.1 ABC transporter substrate-binding protein [Streptomyces sp. PT12]